MMEPKRVTRKRRTETFSTKAALLAKLLPKCAEEYEKLFGHPWSQHPLRLHETDLARSQLEADAWRVMNDLGKAAAAALEFFEGRGLDPSRSDHGIYNAHELQKLLKRHHRLLEGLREKVGKYPRPLDKRHWLAKCVNVSGPNVFAGLPYRRKLESRELAIVSILLTKGEEVTFKRNMTTGDAIEEERRRMALAAKRAPGQRTKKSTRARPSAKPDPSSQ
ncbi:hypothetical protein [Polyangium aurulentum]|uniref:hypothetical protein n=1 Tax=Polyangium aurulentum TaxID=2567896 RepID=UPI0010AE18C6|nr:hypothetical protein [Polyangium aurulentum]UQA57484.1 hypothetical protein E8A73_040395 [Polyangium aurulentum]